MPEVNRHRAHPFQDSAFVQHLMNYPVISNAIDTVKGNEYGRRCIKLGDSAYQTFAAPVIPYFAKPYGYIVPFLTQADPFGDKTLSRIDERLPIIKRPTNDLYNDTKGFVLLPYHKGIEGRNHVLDVFSSEHKKNEQPGLIAYGKAAVVTALVVSNETLTWLGTILNTKKAEASQAASNKVNSH